MEDGLTLVRGIDRELDEAAATDLWRRAAGSPFWLEALAQDGGSGDRSSLIGERLRALSSDAGTLIGAVAVVARPLAVDEAGAVLRWEVGRVGEAARELSARGLANEAAGTIQLTHDLIREAVVATLPATIHRGLQAGPSK